MAAMELDPLFVKALKLLHSKAKDSADQLHQLLIDVLAQKHTSGIIKETKMLYPSVKPDPDGNVKLPSHTKKTSPKHASDIFAIGKSPLEDVRKREGDKRQSDKIKQEPDLSFETKKPRMESPQPFHYSTPSPEPIKTEESVYQKTEEETDSSEGNADADDFAMVMDLACIVCKQIDVTSGNQLIECQECHSLYHQECHRPPATDYDVNDPRRVWYCARCTKNMKKMASKTQKSSKSNNNNSSKEVSLTNRSRSHDNPPILLPFKRTEVKAPVTQGGNHVSTNKPIGLAGLAANLSGRTTTSASTTSAASSKSGSTIKTTAGSTTSSSTKSFSAFPGLMALSPSKTTSSASTSSKITSSGSSFSGLTSLASVAASKSTNLTSVTTTSLSKSSSGLLSSTSSSLSGRSTSSSGSNGNTSTASGGAKPVSSSSLMSADKRLQIMKKKAAAKMQEKRRLSTK